MRSRRSPRPMWTWAAIVIVGWGRRIAICSRPERSSPLACTFLSSTLATDKTHQARRQTQAVRAEEHLDRLAERTFRSRKDDTRRPAPPAVAGPASVRSRGDRLCREGDRSRLRRAYRQTALRMVDEEDWLGQKGRISARWTRQVLDFHGRQRKTIVAIDTPIYEVVELCCADRMTDAVPEGPGCEPFVSGLQRSVAAFERQHRHRGERLR